MTNRSIKNWLLLSLFLPLAGWAQNNTNSPYTQYGLGQIRDNISGSSRAMGGVGVALFDHSEVNLSNPASYAAVDSLTMLFTTGMSLQNTNLTDGTIKLNAGNSSLDYLAMQFRATKGLGITFGMLPFSNIGYDFSETTTDAETANTTKRYYSDCSVDKIFIGAGYQILPQLSIGVNATYIYGAIDRYMSLSFPNNSSAYTTLRNEHYYVHDFNVELGLQYAMQIGKDHTVRLGATYSPGHELSGSSYMRNYLLNSSGTVLESQKTDMGESGNASTYKLGVSYEQPKLRVSAEVLYQDWSKYKYQGNKDAYSDRYRVGIGAEYAADKNGRSYVGRIRYQLGAYYDQPYYNYNGERACKEYGITGGLRLPIFRSGSVLNLAAGYQFRKADITNLLDEKQFTVSIGVTFNERWFFKRKIQ